MVEAGMAEAVPVAATQAQGSRSPPMTDPVTEITPEFQRGWDAALMAEEGVDSGEA